MVYLTANADLAEDLTQETFASAWINIDSYKGRSSLGTWLHKIAYNKFIDSRRRLERDAALIDELKKANRDMPEALNPLYEVMADEQSLALYQAMRKLGDSEYLKIVLHYIQGLSFREMARVLEEPAGTVKWRTSQGLKRLKAILSGEVKL